MSKQEKTLEDENKLWTQIREHGEDVDLIGDEEDCDSGESIMRQAERAVKKMIFDAEIQAEYQEKIKQLVPIDLAVEMKNKDFPTSWDKIKEKYNVDLITDKQTGRILNNDVQEYRSPRDITIAMKTERKNITITLMDDWCRRFGMVYPENTIIIRSDEDILPLEQIMAYTKPKTNREF